MRQSARVATTASNTPRLALLTTLGDEALRTGASAGISLPEGMTLAFEAEIGTGGQVTADLAPVISTGSTFSEGFLRKSDESLSQQAIATVPEMLALIRSTLSLSVTELAAIMGVERPTIYAWTGEKAIPQVRHLERIRSILSIAEACASESPLPIGKAIRSAGKETSILDLLTKEHLDREEILRRVNALRSVESAVRPSIRELAAKHKIKQRVSGQQDAVDWATGKRTTDE